MSDRTHIGPYVADGELGEGGAGRVYRAHAPDGSAVAVKVLLGRGEEKPTASALRRFEREIDALASIAHPGVVPILAHGEDPAFGPYLVMPLVPGRTLRALAAGQRLCPEAVLLLVYGLLDGLGAVHAKGIVHRDVKPENVLVTDDGRVVLVDFGLALSGSHSRATQAGAVAGSVPYMSPEQIEDRELGPASDVWSVGVVAYELLAGKRPFARGTQAEDVAAILGAPRPRTEDADRRVSPAVGQLFDGCFATRPEDRPSAQLLRGRIEFLVDWIGIDAIGAELAYVARDPLGYAARVAPTRVARAKQQAEHALAKGERLAALRHVDRGLAYAPEDAELRALEVRASTVAVEPVAAHSQEVEPPPPSRLQQPRTWALLGVAGLALAGGGTGLGVWIARSPRTPAASASASVALVASSAPAMASTVLAPPPADIAVPTRPRGPFPDVPGIALEDLPNDAPKEPLKDIARPGEPLVPPRLFAGVGGPGPGLASIERQIAEKPADEDLQVGRALALLANRRDAEAFALFSRLEAAHPDDLATLWAAKGFVALRQGKLDDAEAHLSKAIRLDPKDASSYRNRAILRSRAGRLRDAYGDLMAALALQPENLDALEEMARLYDRAKRRRDAVGLIERVVRLRPSDVDAWIDLSVAQGETDLEAAHASVQRALAIAPRNPRAHERLCAVLARKEVPEAVGACTRALELAPGSASVLNNRGMAYYRQGEDVRALADLDRAIAARPTDTSYLINRYLVRAHAGRNDARADLEAACKLGASAACEELAKR